MTIVISFYVILQCVSNGALSFFGLLDLVFGYIYLKWGNTHTHTHECCFSILCHVEGGRGREEEREREDF